MGKWFLRLRQGGTTTQAILSAMARLGVTVIWVICPPSLWMQRAMPTNLYSLPASRQQILQAVR